MSEDKPTKNELIQEGIAATTRQAIKIGKQAQEIRRLQARIKKLEEKLSLYEWKNIPQDFLFPTGRYLIEIIDEDGPKVHIMEVEKTFTAISGVLSFDMPGKRTRYMALPTPPATEGDKE